MNSTVYSPQTNRSSRKGFQLALWFLAACLLAASGCRVAQKTAALPTEMMSAVMRSGESKRLDPAVLQGELLRYADDFLGRTTTGVDEYSRRVNTPEARSEALEWKLTLGTSVLGIASGANPTANLVDFLALSSLLRVFLEQRRAEDALGEALDVWLQNSRLLETNAWKIADGVLSPAQQEEFRTAIRRWLALNTEEG